MSLVIDTSVLIDIEKGKKDILNKLTSLKNLYPSQAKISFISKFEFLIGLKNRSPKNKEKSSAFLDNFEVLHTTNLTINNLLILKEKYEFPLADLIIASQVIEKGDILVTKDKDFENIQELEKIIIS